MSRWSDDALDAHLAAFDLNSINKPGHKQQQQPINVRAPPVAPTASFHSPLPPRPPTAFQPPAVSSVPAYLQKPTDVAASRSYSVWRPPAPAYPRPDATPPSTAGAPSSSYQPTPTLSAASSVAQLGRSPFPAATGHPTSTHSPFAPRPYTLANQSAASSVAQPFHASAAPTAGAPRHVPLPLPQPTQLSGCSAASSPSASGVSAWSSVLPPAFVPPTFPLARGTAAPSTSLPGFGRPSKPAWLAANRSPSPTKLDGGSAQPSGQRAIGPPPGVAAGPWWQQFKLDRAERLKQQQQKRRDDGRVRRQLLASTRVNRQLQQRPAFLDSQFTRHVNQSMEPAEDERRRLREEGGGYKRRAVDRYAHMQCMADRVGRIEHSQQCERVVTWMQRLEEVKQTQSQTERRYVGGEKRGEKRKTAKKADKTGSAKKIRTEGRDRAALAKPSEATADRDARVDAEDDEGDVQLQPLHSAATQANPATLSTEQKDPVCETQPAACLPATRESKHQSTEDERDDEAVVVPRTEFDEDQTLQLDSRPLSPDPVVQALSTRPLDLASLLSTAVLDSSALVDFPDLVSYGAADSDPSALISALLQQMVLSSDAVDDVYVLSFEQPPTLLPSPRKLRAAETVARSQTVVFPTADPQLPPVSKNTSPLTTSAVVSHPHPPQQPSPMSAFSAPAPVQLTPVAPPLPLPPTLRPWPDPRSFMQPAPPRTPVRMGVAQPFPDTSPLRHPPPPAVGIPTSASATIAAIFRSPVSPPPAVAATASPSGSSITMPVSALDAVDREMRKGLAAAKREQWLREHGSSSGASAQEPDPLILARPLPIACEPRESTAVQSPRSRLSVTDVIDLATSSDDEEAPLPIGPLRPLPSAPPAAPALPPRAAVDRTVEPSSTIGGAVTTSIAVRPAAVPLTVSSRASAVSDQPFAAFRAPSAVRDKQRADKWTATQHSQRSDKQRDRAAPADKENVHSINLCTQPLNSIYSQMSQS